MADPGVKIDIKAEGAEQASASVGRVGQALGRLKELADVRRAIGAAVGAFTGFIGIASSVAAVVATVASAIGKMADEFSGASKINEAAREALKRYGDELERVGKATLKAFPVTSVDSEEEAIAAARQRKLDREQELNDILAKGQRDKKVVVEVAQAKKDLDEQAAEEEDRIRQSFRRKREAEAFATVRKESIDRLTGIEKIDAQEREALRETSALRISLANDGNADLAQAQEQAIRARFSRERSEYQKQQAELEADRQEKQRKDAEDAARLAETLAEAMKKANAEARKDFVESMRAVTQELAQQFENSTAAFRGIVEQQARTASRGVWREV